MPGGTVERQFADRRCRTGVGRVGSKGRSSTCVTACVELHPRSSNGSRPVDLDIVWQIALQRVERCLRPDDRVCAIGGGRLIVCFGHSADRAAVGALGVRLATAVGRSVSVDRSRQDIDVVVGVGTGDASDLSKVVGSALSAARACRPKMRATVEPAVSSAARIVVTHMPPRGQPKRLPRREVLPTAPAHTNGGRGHVAPLSSLDMTGQVWDCELNVLLVSLEPVDPQRLNPAIDGLLASMRRIGVAPKVAAGPDPEAVIENYKRTKPEVVVLALHGEALAAKGPRTVTMWEQWARLTRELARDGATVLAVALGASVAAVATCVREGAFGILDVGALSEHLEKLSANTSSRRLAAENGAKDNGHVSLRATLPSPYDRLTYLTTSEHRVLFHMMRGSSASEIAEDLIVSLATVRSHIRSILRKLRVRSQLAAVALANGAVPNTLDSN